jgi:hypothetical protein
MKQTLLSNWNFIRVLRLLMGIAIIVQAVLARDIIFGIAGALFTVLAIFNIGCCGTDACYTPVKKDAANKKEIIYEEVV